MPVETHKITTLQHALLLKGASDLLLLGGASVVAS